MSIEIRYIIRDPEKPYFIEILKDLNDYLNVNQELNVAIEEITALNKVSYDFTSSLDRMSYIVVTQGLKRAMVEVSVLGSKNYNIEKISNIEKDEQYSEEVAELVDFVNLYSISSRAFLDKISLVKIKLSKFKSNRVKISAIFQDSDSKSVFEHCLEKFCCIESYIVQQNNYTVRLKKYFTMEDLKEYLSLEPYLIIN